MSGSFISNGDKQLEEVRAVQLEETGYVGLREEATSVCVAWLPASSSTKWRLCCISGVQDSYSD
jgi:hypothetical protein